MTALSGVHKAPSSAQVLPKWRIAQTRQKRAGRPSAHAGQARGQAERPSGLSKSTPRADYCCLAVAKHFRRSPFVVVATPYLRSCCIVATNMRSKVDSHSLPKRSSEVSKTIHGGSKIDPRRVQNRPKIAQGGPGAARSVPRASQERPRAAQEAPSWAQEAPKRVQVAPKRRQVGPKKCQVGPKRRQVGPKNRQVGLQVAPKRPF